LTDAQLEQLALKKCDSDPPLPKVGDNVFTVWRLRVRPTQLGGDLNSLWSELVSSGLAELPPRVPREWVMVDGHSFVVEFRTADGYRASVIECTKHEVLADTQVQRIGALLYKRLPTAPWLQCGHQ
jgi:hypothetical protein